MSIEELKRSILDCSVSTEWIEAIKEWEHTHIYDIPGSTCVCGHHPITENCEIVNQKNGEVLYVGNECVKHFTDVNTASLFLCIKKVIKNINSSLNLDVLIYYHDNGVLSDWEYKFYSSIWRKRKLSHKQKQIKTNINQKIILKFNIKNTGLDSLLKDNMR